MSSGDLMCWLIYRCLVNTPLNTGNLLRVDSRCPHHKRKGSPVGRGYVTFWTVVSSHGVDVNQIAMSCTLNMHDFYWKVSFFKKPAPPLSRAMLCKCQCTHDPPGTWSRNTSWFSRSGVEPEALRFNKFPGDADAASPRTTLETEHMTHT